jgi:hypothetical protein
MRGSVERTNAFAPAPQSAATVTLLNWEGAPPLSGSFNKMEGRRMTLEVASDVALDTPVRVDIHGGLILGEVAQCARLGNGQFALSVNVREVIPSLSDLARMMEAIRDATRPTASRARI